MILWRNTENHPFFYHFDPVPRFPPFYYMLGGNLGSLLYGGVCVMIIDFCGHCYTPAKRSKLFVASINS